jgi:TRAP-type transport system large permease protein
MTLWPVLLMVVLLVLNVPVALTMIAPPLLYFFLSGDLPIDLVAQRIVATTESYPLLALPFFVLAGSIMNAAGITKRLLSLADAFVGHLVGGLAQVCVIVATLLGGLTASANADAAMLAKMLGPTMIQKGYSRGFAAAVVSCSAMITAMIPPGIGLIVYAYLANVSVGRLFIAGIVPGLLLAAALMGAIYLVARHRNYKSAHAERVSLTVLWHRFVDSIWALTLPIFIVVGIRYGVFTPTEAGAIAVLYATFVGIFLHRELKWSHVPEILRETVAVTSVVMLIIAASSVFSYYMVWERIPSQLATALTALTDSPVLLLLLINIFLLLVGMPLEGTAALILITPILVPVVTKLGIDPIHFGVIMVLNLTIGGVTPPVGTLTFTATSILKVPSSEYTREAMPLLLALLAVLALITAVPQLSLFLPNLLM